MIGQLRTLSGPALRRRCVVPPQQQQRSLISSSNNISSTYYPYHYHQGRINSSRTTRSSRSATMPAGVSIRHLRQRHVDAMRDILGGRPGAVLSNNHSVNSASVDGASAEVAPAEVVVAAEAPHPDDCGGSSFESHTSDWTRLYAGGGSVCFPRDTGEVSRLLRYCNDHGIGVVPQGGNTGLVGGGVGRSDSEVIVSLSKMNRVIDIDVDSAVLYCEAGCVLESLMHAVDGHDLIIPLDLGAKGSCQIGGNVSTNAGGLRVVKYGSMHANVLGLEVVLADGTVLDTLRGLRKDNCGYHLKHMFIGAEGSLGVVTKVALQLHAKPTHTMAMMFKLASFSDLAQLLRRVRAGLGDVLSAFEFIDARALNAVAQAQPELIHKIGGSMLLDVIREHEQAASVQCDNSGTSTNATSTSTSTSSVGIGGPVVALVELSYGDGIDASSAINNSTSTIINSTSTDTSAASSTASTSTSRNGVGIRELVETFCASLMHEEGGGGEEEGTTTSTTKTSSATSTGTGASSTTAAAGSSPLPPLRVLDVLVAQNEAQTRAMWRVREAVPVCLMDLARREVHKPATNATSASTTSTTATTTCTTTTAAPTTAKSGAAGLLRGRVYKYDVSLRVTQMDLFVHRLRQALSARGHKLLVPTIHNRDSNAATSTTSTTSTSTSTGTSAAAVGEGGIGELDVCCFGHIGDGNLHLNVLVRPGPTSTSSSSSTTTTSGIMGRTQRDLDEIVFAEVIAMGGSISAEHGVGQQKAAVLNSCYATNTTSTSGGASATSTTSATTATSAPVTVATPPPPRSSAEVGAMRAIKAALDPRGTMNPGKVLLPLNTMTP